MSPIPGMKGLKIAVDFISWSAIVDQNENVISSISEEAGTLVEEVELAQPGISARANIIPEGRWLFSYNRGIKLIMDMSMKLGKIRYR